MCLLRTMGSAGVIPIANRSEVFAQPAQRALNVQISEENRATLQSDESFSIESAVLLAWALMFLAFALLCWNAPLGYEDESGFHVEKRRGSRLDSEARPLPQSPSGSASPLLSR
jgi:hypothetical protein